MSGRLSKLMIGMLCLVMLFSLFTGCGNTQTAGNQAAETKAGAEATAAAATPAEATAAEATAAGAEKINMKFWMRAASKNSVTGKLVERYNKENTDNATVEFEVYGENYKNVVQMALAAGNPPDIFELNGGLTIPQLAQANYIMPLDQYANEEYKKNFYPEVFKQKQFYYQGKLYAIPERAAFFRLIYNTDLFAKAGIGAPPATLEELKADAKKITDMGKGEYYGFVAALKTASTWGRFTDNVCSISGVTGESAFDWTTGKFDFSKQKKALQFLIDLDKEKIMAPGALLQDIEVARAQFGQGKYAMMIDGNWQVAQFGNNEIKCDVKWDSAPIPVFEGDKRGKSFMFFDMSKLIASGSKYKDQAWNFVKFLLDNQSEFVKNGEPLRTMIKANDPANIPQNYLGIKNFTDIQNSKAFPLQVQNFLTKLEGDKVDMVYQSIFAGKTPIDKGLEDLSTRYNAALDKALQDGEITREDIIIPGFDYFDYYSK